MGLTGADGAKESRPEPGVSSEMQTARPASVCGSSNLNKPPASSSPGSVASLLIVQQNSTKRKTSQQGGNRHVHALQCRQHKEAIAKRIVFCHLVQSVARIVRIDSTSKNWVICYRAAEHAPQPLLTCTVVTCEWGQEPVRHARTTPQRPNGRRLPVDKCELRR